MVNIRLFSGLMHRAGVSDRVRTEVYLVGFVPFDSHFYVGNGGQGIALLVVDHACSKVGVDSEDKGCGVWCVRGEWRTGHRPSGSRSHLQQSRG